MSSSAANTMKKKKKGILEHHDDDDQELEILKAVAQAWLGRNSSSSSSQDSHEFDARRLNFKAKPTRFRVEAIATKKKKQDRRSTSTSTSSGYWDFQQSLWDSYEIVSVSKKLEGSLLMDNPFSESVRRRKESKNSLRNLLNIMSSRRFDELSIPREEEDDYS